MFLKLRVNSFISMELYVSDLYLSNLNFKYYPFYVLSSVKLGDDLVVVDHVIKVVIISFYGFGEYLGLVNLFGWNIFDLEWQVM